jgi:hypothetical protein
MRLQLIIAALAIVTGSAAFAGDIYRWVDAEGNVQYGDRPDNNANAERLAIESRPTDPAQVQQTIQARLDRQQMAAEAAASGPQPPTKEELREEAEERRQQCDMYTERLQRYIQFRHLYREDENGERTYLDEAQMQAEQDLMQDRIHEFCTP